MFRLLDGEEIMTLAFFVLIQYRSVTDRRTDGPTDRQTDIPPLAIPAVCIACYANALVKSDHLHQQSLNLCGGGMIDKRSMTFDLRHLTAGHLAARQMTV